MIDTGDIDVFLGLDVGKGEYQATAVTPAGKKAFDKRLPNTEPKLRELFAKLKAEHRTVLVVVAWTGTTAGAALGVTTLALATAAALATNWPLLAFAGTLAAASHAVVAASARACRRCARLPVLGTPDLG
ncbi:transposase [Streptomyces sp. NPDC018338]|uniref:IS110 family transposase n=1 Tax=Streptomyces sp. NPDC018338 TaxID=3157192 RepID=UPI0033FADBFB